LLPSSSAPDPDVIAFFHASALRRKSPETQRAYAHDIKVHLEFLGAKGKPWRQVSSQDLDDFEFWRRRDTRNPFRVSDSKFNRELAACRLFYEFQARRGSIKASPVELMAYTRRDGSTGSAAVLRVAAKRRNDVKWLTPSAFRFWARVGLAGYGLDEVPDVSWRGRNDGRNLALVEYLWSSGLRIREAGTLLLPEIPDRHRQRRYYKAKVAAAVAKREVARPYWVSDSALSLVDSYVMSTRQQAVDRARSEGRYERLQGKIIVSTTVGKAGVRIAHESGRVGRATFDQLDPFERMRLYRETEHGLEPLALWLGDSGLPMRFQTWQSVFTAANERMTRLRVATSAGPLHCHAHMLRHSFALRMLITLLHVFDPRVNLEADERKEYREMFGDPWVYVSHLLGHANVETTRNVYLEPAKGLQVDALLNDVDDDLTNVGGLLAQLANETNLIHDLPSQPESEAEDG
jgi:site-specific recombinase XerD